VQNFNDSARSSEHGRPPKSIYCSAKSGGSATGRIPAKGAAKWQIKRHAASADELSAHQAKPESTKEIARENPDKFILLIAIHSIHNQGGPSRPPFFFQRSAVTFRRRSLILYK
jgi:hypothetical protein